MADALGLFAPTDEQAAVIAAPPGPLVVIAGAGAGKTETMAARVVWLVANGFARPGDVLGLTFTRKAAGQLLRRVRARLARLAGAGLLVPGAVDMADDPVTVSTYHAFAGTLLRDHAEHGRTVFANRVNAGRASTASIIVGKAINPLIYRTRSGNLIRTGKLQHNLG